MFYLNKNKVTSKEVSGQTETKVSNIMLDKGWNHIVIKLVNPQNDSQLKPNIRFQSADNNFMKQILSSVVR